MAGERKKVRKSYLHSRAGSIQFSSNADAADK